VPHRLAPTPYKSGAIECINVGTKLGLIDIHFHNHVSNYL